MTKEQILLAIVINILSSIVCSLLVKGYKKYNPIEKLLKMKITKIIGFIFLYLFPLATIIYLLIDKTLELNFFNVGLFVIVCIVFIFNVLMSHITTLFGMIGKLANSGSDKLTKIDETFDKVHGHIEQIKKDNNLK